MYVHPGVRAIYLAHPRTASRATARALQTIGFHRRGGHHGRVEEEGSEHGIESPDDWTIFTAVRNHYDALVSWRFRHPAASQFTIDWVRSFVTNRRRRYVRNHRLYWLHSEAADEILRYETLEPDLNDVLEDLGFGPIELDHVTDGHRPPGGYRDQYSDEARAFVEGYFKHELDRFGYEY